jgi:hypothetical protein
MRWLFCLGLMLAGCGVVRSPSRTSALKGISTLLAAEAEYQCTYGRGLYDFGYSGSAGRQQQVLFLGSVAADSRPQRGGHSYQG